MKQSDDVGEEVLSAELRPGSHAFHPTHGMGRVLGEREAVVEGQHIPCLAIEPFGHPKVLLLVPLAKLASLTIAGLIGLTPQEVLELAGTSAPPLTRDQKSGRNSAPQVRRVHSGMSKRGRLGADARWRKHRMATG